MPPPPASAPTATAHATRPRRWARAAAKAARHRGPATTARPRPVPARSSARPSGLARAHLGRRVARRSIRNHKPRTGTARESWPRPAEYEWPIRAIGAIDRKAEAEPPAAAEPEPVAGCVAAGAPPKEGIGAEGIVEGVVVVRIAEADPETVVRAVSVARGDFPRVYDVGGGVIVEATGRIARHASHDVEQVGERVVLNGR